MKTHGRALTLDQRPVKLTHDKSQQMEDGMAPIITV